MAVAKISEKLELYGKKVPGISAYANGWLPLILAATLWGLVTTDLLALPLYDVAIKAGYLSLAIMSAITIRTPDKMALVINLSFLGYAVARDVYNAVSLFAAVTDAANIVGGAMAGIVGNNSLLASGVALGMGAATGGAVLGIILSLALTLFFCIFYIGVFVGHRKFFLASVKELQEDN